MSALQEVFKILTPLDTWVEVSPELYARILTEMTINQELPPRPPVKRRKEGYGFFNRGIEIEYDTRCPDYLKRLEAFRGREVDCNTLQIYGPWGPVEIRKMND